MWVALRLPYEATLPCTLHARKKNVDDSSLSGPRASLHISQITHNWNDPAMCLAHVFLVSCYEWKIHNYLFQKQNKTRQNPNFFICFVKSLFVWKQDQELLLNSKSACMGWAMSGTELERKSFLCTKRVLSKYLSNHWLLCWLWKDKSAWVFPHS